MSALRARLTFSRISVALAVHWLVTGLIEGTMATAAGVDGPNDVRRCAVRVARFTADTAVESKDLKRFLRAWVYQSEAVTCSRKECRQRIAALFEFFPDHPNRLPEGQRESHDPLHRRVCDYIAGMTDGFFLKTCHQMRIGRS
jgi:dGTPase